MILALGFQNWDIDLEEPGRLLILSVAVALAVYLFFRLAVFLIRRVYGLSDSHAAGLFTRSVRAPIFWLTVTMCMSLIAHSTSFGTTIWDGVSGLAFPALAGWLALACVRGVTHALTYRMDENEDPVATRGRKTRLTLLSHILSFAILVVTIGLILIKVPSIREVGVTMMASAGFAALVLGAAAQPALRSLIAGMQMALTEPVRIGDMVVVGGHTGRVETIRMSFVLLRCWDERLVVVPTTRFLDETFENWSRNNEALTGAVFLRLDPIADVAAIRTEYMRWVKHSPLWDERTADVLMTEAYAESIELRLSVSARSIGDLWTLRCELREHMLAWLRDHHPEALIRHRLEVDAANQSASGR